MGDDLRSAPCVCVFRFDVMFILCLKINENMSDVINKVSLSCLWEFLDSVNNKIRIENPFIIIFLTETENNIGFSIIL